MEITKGIREFNPEIYPTRLWVSVNPSFDDVNSIFYGLTDKMERIDISQEQFSKDSFTIATTIPVSSIESGWIGMLVSIWKPKQLDIKTICHESSHCADFICENFGISNGSFEHGEARAYLQGWIADCIYKVKTGK